MGDTFIEQLVKQRQTTSNLLKKCGLIVLTVLSVFLVLLMPVLLPLPVLLIVLDVFLIKRMDLEFEYSYFNGDLDIDKIMAKQSRKRVFSTDMESVIVVAPVGSIELQPYKQLKCIDFSSNTGNGKVYELVTNSNGRKVKVLLEPSQELLDGMRMKAPRKVFI